MKKYPQFPSRPRIAKFLARGLFAISLGLFTSSSFAATATWNGSASSLWSAANWTGSVGAAPASGDSLVFTSATGLGGTTLTDNLMTPGTFNVAGITFSSGAAAFTINTNTVATNGFTLTGNVANSSISLQTINDLIATTAVRTFTMTTGGGNITLGGNISGAAGGITTAGAGTLTLSGNESFTGALSVAANTTVIMSGSNAARPAGTNGLTAVTGTLQLQASSSNTVSGTSFALSAEQTANQPLTLNNGSMFQLRSDNSVTFAGGNNFGGVGNATISVDVNQLTGAGANRILTFAPGGAGFAATTFNVTGGNGYTLSTGTLTGVNFSTKALTLNPTTANLMVAGISNAVNGPITVQGSGTTTVTGVINGAGTLTKSGAGALILSGSNTYTGLTTINAGVMQFNAGAGNTLTGTSMAMSPSSQITINSGGTIGLRADSDTTFTTSLLNPSGGTTTTYDVGAVSAGGNNTLTLNSTGSFLVGGGAGATMTFNVTGVNGDRLKLSGGNINLADNTNTWVLNPTTANLTVANAVTNTLSKTGLVLVLDGTSSGNLFSGNISSSNLSVTKSNNSTWTLTGSNSYTGATNVTAGTLIVSGSLMGTASVSVSSGAILRSDGLINTAVATTLASGATLTGAGTIGGVTANAGSTIAPSAGTTLTSTAGGVSFGDGTAHLSIKLGQTTAGDNSQLALTSGAISLNGATLDLVLGTNYARQADGFTYVIINGGASATGTSGNLFAQGSSITASNGDVFSILYGVDATGASPGNDVVLQLQAVPEPNTWAMMIGGLGMLVRFQRIRRNRKA